ncbi:amino acid adenylation domain-containing protein [Crossiella equi]|uniref:Amino acid adenylation domain-containing protein n=2 Tax=Crossiella equi TaxID=130796 RepID=A0ABS5A4E1_9PSEU|nr:amino acid adenylation domain-containing protein [Crossiella equi]MBP2471443.1 amino acid adenylation domain-containing protein [Crossiella equi]
MAELRGPRAAHPRDTPVDELFRQVARAHPDRVVLRADTGAHTYRELAEGSAHVAAALAGAGVRPGELVAVAVREPWHLLLAVLGVLRAGAAYLPLDRANPPARTALLLADAQARLTLVDGPDPALTGPVLDLTSLPGAPAPVLTGRGGEDLAYVMYTSGSTGQPKGVAVPHRAIARLLMGTDYVRLSGADVIALGANPAFDASTFELWGALLHGATLVAVDRETLLTPFELREFLATNRITTLFLTPALFHLHAHVDPGVFGGLRWLVVGGDALDPVAAAEVLRTAPPTALVNGYGPTECTTFAVAHRVTEADCAGRIPIGRPITGTDAQVLDESGHPAEEGELYLAGDGLALGYLGREQLTAERFPVLDGVRHYRTGDRVRVRPDGLLDFLGRFDDQIKVRGFRVEPGEVEAAVRAVPGIRAAAVLAVAGELVAFVVGEREPGARVGAHLTRTLPHYLVPAAVHELPELPLTANGKVDRAALREGVARV